MNDADDTAAMDALTTIISTLGRLDESKRRRVLESVGAFFGLSISDGTSPGPGSRLAQPAGLRKLGFSDDHTPTPREFMFEKQPRSDVERIACLAYYLTHYRDTPHFQTLDLAKLNTEAAQPKFSNTAYAAHNAANLGYLAHVSKGLRQLSAIGEQFVTALPDREAAKRAMSGVRPRRKEQKKPAGAAKQS